MDNQFKEISEFYVNFKKESINLLWLFTQPLFKRKSRKQETLNILDCADSSTDTKQNWVIDSNNIKIKKTYVWIGIGIVCGFQNLQIGIEIIICQMGSSRKLFTNTWNIFVLLFLLKNLPGKQSNSDIYPYLYIYSIYE